MQANWTPRRRCRPLRRTSSARSVIRARGSSDSEAGGGRRRSRSIGYVEDDVRAASRAPGAPRRRTIRPTRSRRAAAPLIRSSSSPFSALTRRRALLAGTETLGGTRPDGLVKTRHRSRPWRRRGRSPTATLCLAGGEARAQVILTAAPHQHPRRCAAPARRLRGSPGASCSATCAPRRRSWTARRSSTTLSPVWEEGEERVARLRRPIWGSPGGRGGLTRCVGAVAN